MPTSLGVKPKPDCMVYVPETKITGVTLFLETLEEAFLFSNEKHQNVVETFLVLFQIEMVLFGVLKAKPSQKFGFKTKKRNISVLF